MASSQSRLLRDRRGRGFTLLELLVASSIALLVVSAATAVFASIQAQRSASERRLSVVNAAMSAFLIIQRDVQNAGYKFPSPLFAVRVHDHPASLSSGGAAPSTIDATSGCPDGSGGLVDGTDVLEVAVGDNDRTSGLVTAAAPDGGGGYLVSFATLSPFGTDDASGPARVVMFGSQTVPGQSCLALVSPYTGSPTTATPLKRDYEPAATTLYPNCPTNPTVVGWILGRRIRYLVCQGSAAGSQPGLYRQETTDPSGVFTSAPVLVQEGIEDFQVALRLSDADSVLSTTPPADCDCETAPTTAGGYCYCAMKGAATIASTEPTTLDETSNLTRLTGLRIGITARRDFATGPANTQRPALLNNPLGAADTIPRIRHSRIEMVNLPNLTIVSM